MRYAIDRVAAVDLAKKTAAYFCGGGGRVCGKNRRLVWQLGVVLADEEALSCSMMSIVSQLLMELGRQFPFRVTILIFRIRIFVLP